MQTTTTTSSDAVATREQLPSWFKDSRDYSLRLTISPSALLDNFGPEERAELLDHFQTPEAFADWVMEGIIDYWGGDGLSNALDESIWDVHDRLSYPESERYW